MNADHVGNLSAPILSARARHARAFALAQASDQLAMQLTPGLSVDRVAARVNGNETPGGNNLEYSRG